MIEQWKPFLDIARESGQPVNTGEYRVTCSDGSVRICELYATFLADRLVVTFNDITERKRAEENRFESAERFRITLMNIGDGVITTDVEGRIDLMNPVAENIIGWSQEEVLGRPLEEVFHIINEKTRLPVENPVLRVLREGIIVGLANHTVLIRRDGTELPIADSGAPIFGTDGAIIGTVLIFRDQTAEQTARRSSRRWRGVFLKSSTSCPTRLWPLTVKNASSSGTGQWRN